MRAWRWTPTPAPCTGRARRPDSGRPAGSIGIPGHGPTSADLLAWCGRAGQPGYAGLAPGVFGAEAQGDRVAAALLHATADELGPVGAPLPIVLTASIGVRLRLRWPAELQAQCVEAQGDSADGALQLIRAALVEPGGNGRPSRTR